MVGQRVPCRSMISAMLPPPPPTPSPLTSTPLCAPAARGRAKDTGAKGPLRTLPLGGWPSPLVDDEAPGSLEFVGDRLLQGMRWVVCLMDPGC